MNEWMNEWVSEPISHNFIVLWGLVRIFDQLTLYQNRCSDQWEGSLLTGGKKLKQNSLNKDSLLYKSCEVGLLSWSRPDPTLTSSSTSLSGLRYIYTSCLNLISDRYYYLRKSKLPLPALMNYCTKYTGIWEPDRFINECLIKGTVTEFWGRGRACFHFL